MKLSRASGQGAPSSIYAALLAGVQYEANTRSDCMRACKLGHPKIMPLPRSCCSTATMKSVLGDGGGLPSKLRVVWVVCFMSVGDKDGGAAGEKQDD